MDDNFSPKRATDFSAIARLGSFAIRWQWLVWVVCAILLAVGFNFQTPSQKFAEVSATVVANRNAIESRVNGVERRLNDTDQRMTRALTILEGLAIDACDRLQTNRYARRQLDCKEVVR